MSTPTADPPRPEFVMVSTTNLQVHPWHQAHVPSSNNADKVKADMRTYGFRREHPLLISSLSGTVLDGATRLAIATASYVPANDQLPMARVPAIIVPCETVQDEIDTIARTVLSTRQLTPGQYELLAYDYMKTLSAKYVTDSRTESGKKKGKKKSVSVAPTDTLAVSPSKSPAVVVEQQNRRDARAETAKLFKVPEIELKRINQIAQRSDADKYFHLMRSGQMTARGVDLDIKLEAKKAADLARVEAAKRMTVPDSWRNGDGTMSVNISLKENEVKFKLAVTTVEHLAAVSPHVDPTGFLLLVVDDWQVLKTAAEGASKFGFDQKDLLVGDYSREKEPGSKIHGTVGMALLCRRPSTELVGRIERVENALAEDPMPPARMFGQVISATTIAEEAVLVTAGTVEQYQAIKKLNRHPFVISANHDEYLRGVAAIGEPKSDPPACLVSPETLREEQNADPDTNVTDEVDEILAAHVTETTEPVVPVATVTEEMPVVMPSPAEVVPTSSTSKPSDEAKLAAMTEVQHV